jgi:hypothetical protein
VREQGGRLVCGNREDGWCAGTGTTAGVRDWGRRLFCAVSDGREGGGLSYLKDIDVGGLRAVAVGCVRVAVGCA